MNFKERIESQEEIESILDEIFKKVDVMNEKEFLYTIENIKSEIFLYVQYNS